MTIATSGLVDQYGIPIRRELLTREVAGPAITGVRSPYNSFSTDGMTPSRLSSILCLADQGDPMAYFELAETIEERDLHYAGVLQTRKRSVAQIDMSVEAASDDPIDVEKADRVREWLKRDELADEIFDMLDAVAKQISFTEIVWDTSAGQWQPARLEWRDPKWFTFAQRDLTTPLLRGGIDEVATAVPLPAFKFIATRIKAKSGIPVRSGLTRLVSWSWMFKAFTQRDWAIFTQTYGQPVRLGKFSEGATKEDKATLFRAVANIAGDCAAIIPSSMEIDFIEAKNVGPGSDLYEKRADWLDRQVSKAVLGQTTTTDAISGGHAVSQEHRKVQEDIETADCKSLAAAINRDLIRPWMDLEYGPSQRYPRVVIARPQQEDLKQLTESLAALIPLGLKVQASEIRDKLGLSEPEPDSELLQAASPPAPAVAAPAADDPVSSVPALQSAEAPPSADPTDAATKIALQLAQQAEAPIAAMTASIETMLGQAGDLAEFREMLVSAFGQDAAAKNLAEVIAGGLQTARSAGLAAVADKSNPLPQEHKT